MKSKYILITGVDGRLGGALVKELTRSSQYGIIAVSLEKRLAYNMLEREGISDRRDIIILDQEDFFANGREMPNIEAAIHLAFARGNMPSSDIAGSLDYARDVYWRLYDLGVPKVVYFSSQSVYGKTHEWRTETTPPSPESVYAMAKYAGEKLLESCFGGDSRIIHTILRLDYVIQSQKLIPVLCKDAKEKGVLTLKGGKQVFSYIDKTDVAKAVMFLLRTDNPWKPLYNVGPNKMRYSLMEVAEIVRQVSERKGKKGVSIVLEENDTELWSGMDSTQFMNDTGWKPLMDLDRMVEAIYEEV